MKVKIFEEDELREKLKITDDKIKIVLDYQKLFPELLQFNAEGFCIDARNLHKNLVENVKEGKVGDKFSQWIKRRLDKYNFEENVDYIKYYNCNDKQFSDHEMLNMSQQKMARNNITIDYKVTLDMAILLCEKEKYSQNSHNLIQFLYLFKDKNTKIIFKNNKRPEINFLDKLEEGLKPFNIKGVRQYYVFDGKYRIDYYIESLNIAIEYDESQHNTGVNKERDLIRQKEIENKLNCRFIRVSINNSDEYNIGFIIKNIFNL